jgi:hypothetical protein
MIQRANTQFITTLCITTRDILDFQPALYFYCYLIYPAELVVL